jgi:hypothetical protein
MTTNELATLSVTAYCALPIVADALATLAPEAKAALLDGSSWDSQPETIDGADDFPWFCSDCDTWHHEWRVVGWRVADDRLYCVVWTVDSDGNWEVMNAAIVGDPYLDILKECITHAEAQSYWKDYYMWVLNTGRDPLAIADFTDDDIATTLSGQVTLRRTADNHVMFLSAAYLDPAGQFQVLVDWHSLHPILQDFLYRGRRADRLSPHPQTGRQAIAADQEGQGV